MNEIEHYRRAAREFVERYARGLFDEQKHPRNHGKFAEKAGAGAESKPSAKPTKPQGVAAGTEANAIAGDDLASMQDSLKQIDKSNKKLDKFHESANRRDKGGGRSRANTTTSNARTGQEAQVRDHAKDSLRKKVRGHLAAGRDVPQEYLDSLGKTVDYDDDGAYAPVEAEPKRKSAGMDILVSTVDTLTDDQVKDTYRGVSGGSTREDALVRAALYTAWEKRHGNESATSMFDGLDAETAKAPIEPESATKPPGESDQMPKFKSQGVTGGQMGLFADEPSGQKTLFNVVKPAKGKKSASRDDLLAGIGGKLKEHLKEKDVISPADLSTKFQDEALPGQKSLFRRSGSVERYEQGEHWVTIGGTPSGDAQHSGGSAVKLDGQGNIIGGNVPAQWQGQHISQAGASPPGGRAPAPAAPDWFKGKGKAPEKKGSAVKVQTKNMGNRWYSMATLPDGKQVTRSHDDQAEAEKLAGQDIDKAGHHVDDGTVKTEADPPSVPEQATAAATPAAAAPPRLVNPLPTASRQPRTRDDTATDSRQPRTRDTEPPKSGTAGVMKAADIKRSPEKFQYKLNTDKEGVTAKFKDVKFNPDLAGRLEVWQDPESGDTFVVNGHHRHELAERSGFDGELSVYHLTAANEQEARAKGALINISGGQGTAIDAAKYFRDSKQSPASLKEDGVSLTESLTQDALALAKLSPALFTPLTHGIYRQGRALAIAKHLDDHEAQEELDRLIESKEDRQSSSVSDHVVAEMARQMALTARIEAGPQQPVLPGMETSGPKTRSTLAERAEISSAIRRGMTGRLNKFKAVSNERAAETLGSHNTIDADANRDEAKQIAGDLDTFDRESVFRGPISDLLNKAAEELADEPGRKSEIIDRVTEEVSRYRPPVPGDDQGGDAGSESRSGERYKPAAGQKDFFSRSRNGGWRRELTERIHSRLSDYS